MHWQNHHPPREESGCKSVGGRDRTQRPGRPIPEKMGPALLPGRPSIMHQPAIDVGGRHFGCNQILCIGQRNKLYICLGSAALELMGTRADASRDRQRQGVEKLRLQSEQLPERPALCPPPQPCIGSHATAGWEGAHASPIETGGSCTGGRSGRAELAPPRPEPSLCRLLLSLPRRTTSTAFTSWLSQRKTTPVGPPSKEPWRELGELLVVGAQQRMVLFHAFSPELTRQGTHTLLRSRGAC